MAKPPRPWIELKVYGPKVCEAKTSARAKMNGTYDTLPSDAALRIEPR
jgi:hypothetical protein